MHIDGLERIAEAAAKYDVDRFIHVSSHNADANSPSEFFRTKVGLLGLGAATDGNADLSYNRLAVRSLQEVSTPKQP